VPQAHRLAARIQERDWDDFTCDPTQLANGLRDLVDAVGPDGVAVSLPDVLLEGGPDVLGSEQLSAAVEATRRLKASMGERVALVACLPPPGALTGGADALLDVGKAFLAAGADALVVWAAMPTGAAVRCPPCPTSPASTRHPRSAAPPARPPPVELVPLGAPRPVRGLALTDVHVPRETDVSTLEDWVDVVRG
jgi:hypothetical protein